MSSGAAGELEQSRVDLAAASDRADNLEVALLTSRRIGMALGILMERHRMTEEQAFDQLRELSNRSNVKLQQVAEQIVYTGDHGGLDSGRATPQPTA